MNNSQDSNENIEEEEDDITRNWRKLIETLRGNLFKPFFVGLSGSFGICVGYALFDYLSASPQIMGIVQRVFGSPQVTLPST